MRHETFLVWFIEFNSNHSCSCWCLLCVEQFHTNAEKHTAISRNKIWKERKSSLLCRWIWTIKANIARQPSEEGKATRHHKNSILFLSRCVSAEGWKWQKESWRQKHWKTHQPNVKSGEERKDERWKNYDFFPLFNGREQCEESFSPRSVASGKYSRDWVQMWGEMIENEGELQFGCWSWLNGCATYSIHTQKEPNIVIIIIESGWSTLLRGCNSNEFYCEIVQNIPKRIMLEMLHKVITESIAIRKCKSTCKSS